jgi:hypothetical protein
VELAGARAEGKKDVPENPAARVWLQRLGFTRALTDQILRTRSNDVLLPVTGSIWLSVPFSITRKSTLKSNSGSRSRCLWATLCNVVTSYFGPGDLLETIIGTLRSKCQSPHHARVLKHLQFEHVYLYPRLWHGIR